MIQGMTAHYLVHTTGRVKPGDKVLIHAISGGTGSLVCQVAKNAGNSNVGFGNWKYILRLLSCCHMKKNITVPLQSTSQ